MILEVVQRPELLHQVRAEIAPHVVWTPSSSDPIKVDIDALCQQTLVQSIYAEVLRVHNGTVISRVPKSSGFNIGGWNFPKDEPIMVSTFDTARDSKVWNQGTPDDPHPVDQFWPERFILDPDSVSSGPVLPQNGDGQQSQQKQHETEDEPQRPKFSLDGTDGSWVPYGGGSRMCPGRHFAKKELIVTMAIFLTAFEIELLPRDGLIENDMTYFMFGVMHPKGPIPARIRRRKPLNP
jgi:cytochrome P450